MPNDRISAPGAGTSLISRDSHDALRALLRIADGGGSAPLELAALAAALGLAAERLEPLLARLAQARIVRATGSGYSLTRPASVISFGDVLRGLGEPLALGSLAAVRRPDCKDCSDQRLCAVHRALGEAGKASAAVLDAMTLAEAAGWQREGDSDIELFDPCI